MEPVGELDHEHADVPGHGHQHLAEVLGLPLLAGGEGELADLGDAVHQLGDLAPELARSSSSLVAWVSSSTSWRRPAVTVVTSILKFDEEAGDLEGVG